MLVINRSFVVVAALTVGLLASGCATMPGQDATSEPAPAQAAAEVPAMTLEEAARLSEEAEQHIVERRLSEANALYARIVKAYPNNAQAWFRLGTVYMRGGHYGYAQVAFQQALRADPLLTKSQANLALAHLHQFRAAAAQAVLSAQVPAENRKALASLVRDVDHAITPGGSSPATAP